MFSLGERHGVTAPNWGYWVGDHRGEKVAADNNGISAWCPRGVSVVSAGWMRELGIGHHGRVLTTIHHWDHILGNDITVVYGVMVGEYE